MMSRISTAWRMSFGLALLTVSVVLAADFIGLIPNRFEAALEGRKQLCESLAIQSAVCLERNDLAAVEATMRLEAERNRHILSASMRTMDGTVLARTGDDRDRPPGKPGKASVPTNVRVPIFMGNEQWGTMEVRFDDITPGGVRGLWANSSVKLALFVTLLGFVAYLFFLKRTLRYLDPSSVVPKRVKSALDTLVEGVVLLDKDERIVLANAAFARNVGRSEASLLGQKASQLNWKYPTTGPTSEALPWTVALREGRVQSAVPLEFAEGPQGARKLMVNAAAICDEHSGKRGTIATFDDVTELDRQSVQLRQMLHELELSRDEIRRQNQELEQLATKDPLTGCLNRRAFFERLQTEFLLSQRHNHELACIMLDIDHFKAINDHHGHSAGDEVLKALAQTLRSSLRVTDAVCRYGGEEFCILLPSTSAEKAAVVADHARCQIAANKVQDIQVTASFGVSGLAPGITDPQQMLDQADKALYQAKDRGRNRVVRWKESTPTNGSPEPASAEAPDEKEPPVDEIHTRAVQVLVSALAWRDVRTAEHCKQVADLCVACAQGLGAPNATSRVGEPLLSHRECLVLEVAGQLHDLGKLGVPDAILNKPQALSPEERKIVREHLRLGVEIVTATCSSRELAEILGNHQAWYGGRPEDPDLPVGRDIPLGARILAIADAFSAMVSPRPFPGTRTYDEAFAELRRCAGRQFDPELVERFIEAVRARDETRAGPKPMISDAMLLEIGQTVEKIAVALDNSDFSQLSVIAGRLAAIATENGMEQVAEWANQMVEAARTDGDLLTIARLTQRLFEACRLPSPTSLRWLSSPATGTPAAPRPGAPGADPAGPAGPGLFDEILSAYASPKDGTKTDTGE
ncbi:MAG: diguanylate cyclase [Planctomycetes bacterium]|nr:diguanylate cyclase [Planctomycetota bacterium]